MMTLRKRDLLPFLGVGQMRLMVGYDYVWWYRLASGLLEALQKQVCETGLPSNEGKTVGIEWKYEHWWYSENSRVIYLNEDINDKRRRTVRETGVIEKFGIRSDRGRVAILARGGARIRHGMPGIEVYAESQEAMDRIVILANLAGLPKYELQPGLSFDIPEHAQNWMKA